MRLLILLFCPLFMFGQKNCAGIVVDKLTGKGISYATIGLVKENRGISANEHGAFSISASFANTDSLRISSVGYQTTVLPVSEWIEGKIVPLQQQESLLPPVVISPIRQREVYTLNDFRNCSSNWYQTGIETFYQLAQRFDAQEHGMQLTHLELCKDPSESIFRLRIYDLDPASQGPSTDLADTIIEVKSKERHVHIDLENYKIFIPGKSFFVAIEWLFTPFNEEIQKQKSNGRKRYTSYYKPFVRFVFNRKAKPGYVWRLEFNGKWSTMTYNQNYNFQITPILKTP